MLTWFFFPSSWIDLSNHCVFCCQEKSHLHSTSEQESLKWNFYEYVPKCLSSHLTAFQFKGFKGLKDELELIGHILQMARVLKTMTLSSDHSTEKEKIRVLKELVMFPRHSSTCQITFNWCVLPLLSLAAIFIGVTTNDFPLNANGDPSSPPPPPTPWLFLLSMKY